jgi:hypothetical protein
MLVAALARCRAHGALLASSSTQAYFLKWLEEQEANAEIGSDRHGIAGMRD